MKRFSRKRSNTTTPSSGANPGNYHATRDASSGEPTGRSINSRTSTESSVQNTPLPGKSYPQNQSQNNPPQRPNLYRNHSAQRSHSQPLLLMTPPLLSNKNSLTSSSATAGADQEAPLFDGFDGVHINEEECDNDDAKSTFTTYIQQEKKLEFQPPKSSRSPPKFSNPDSSSKGLIDRHIHDPGVSAAAAGAPVGQVQAKKKDVTQSLPNLPADRAKKSEASPEKHLHLQHDYQYKQQPESSGSKSSILKQTGHQPSVLKRTEHHHSILNRKENETPPPSSSSSAAEQHQDTSTMEKDNEESVGFLSQSQDRRNSSDSITSSRYSVSNKNDDSNHLDYEEADYETDVEAESRRGKTLLMEELSDYDSNDRSSNYGRDSEEDENSDAVVEEVKEITKEEFNAPKLYHPTPKRVIEHNLNEEDRVSGGGVVESSVNGSGDAVVNGGNDDDEKENDKRLLNQNTSSSITEESIQQLQDKLETAAINENGKDITVAHDEDEKDDTVSGVAPSTAKSFKPLIAAPRERLVGTPRTRQHNKSLSHSINTPMHTPRESVGQVSLGGGGPVPAHQAATGTGSGGDYDSRRESVASMRSKMSARRSVLDPRPTSTAFSPPTSGFGDYNEPGVFYPAPIPVQLRLPPLLSKKNKSQANKSGGGGGSSAHSEQLNFNPRRASTILQPPTWSINPIDRESMMSLGEQYPVHSTRQSVYSNITGDGTSSYGGGEGFEDVGLGSRSASPALSMDSGRATIESGDDDDRNLDPEVGDRNADPLKSKKSKKNKKKSKTKSLFKKKKPDYLEADSDDEYNNIDLGDGQVETDPEKAATRNVDHLAFTHYNPSNVEGYAHGFALGGASQVKPMSLIEELEMRKAGRKAQTKLIRDESTFEQREVESSKRISQHPLDVRHSRSLMQLQQLANQDYQDQVAYQEMVRSSHYRRRDSSSPQTLSYYNNQDFVDQNVDPNETLTARRQRLKEAKRLAKEQAASETETLAQRRARLKRQSQLVSAP